MANEGRSWLLSDIVFGNSQGANMGLLKSHYLTWSEDSKLNCVQNRMSFAVCFQLKTAVQSPGNLASTELYWIIMGKA